MRRLIIFIFFQFIFIQASHSQVDRIKELARKTWTDYVDARNRMDLLEQELKYKNSQIKNLEKDKENNLEEIHKFGEQQDNLKKKLRKSQTEYLKKNKEVQKASDSIRILNIQNSELDNLSDSFSLALEKEQSVVKQLADEKRELEKTLYYKIADLEIAEVENSYFSDFDIGYEGKKNEIIYSENSKGQSTKPIFRKLEFLRFEGSVYTPPNIDSLVGKILIYKNDKLFDFIPRSFSAYTKTNSYNYFEITEKDIRLKEKIPARSNLKIAFVIDKVYSINKKTLEDFNESYKSALFVMTSLKPVTSLEFVPVVPPVPDDVSESVFFKTSIGNLKISIVNSLDYFTNEYITLSINDSIIKKEFKLLTYDEKFSCKYEFEKGTHKVKIKCLSGSTIKGLPDCYLWLYLTTIDDEKVVYKKKVVLKKDQAFVINLERQ